MRMARGFIFNIDCLVPSAAAVLAAGLALGQQLRGDAPRNASASANVCRVGQYSGCTKSQSMVRNPSPAAFNDTARTSGNTSERSFYCWTNYGMTAIKRVASQCFVSRYVRTALMPLRFYLRQYPALRLYHRCPLATVKKELSKGISYHQDICARRLMAEFSRQFRSLRQLCDAEFNLATVVQRCF
jgi:hypothetical protein